MRLASVKFFRELYPSIVLIRRDVIEHILLEIVKAHFIE